MTIRVMKNDLPRAPLKVEAYEPSLPFFKDFERGQGWKYSCHNEEWDAVGIHDFHKKGS